MINLTTRFMGIELKNPIIAGASNMSADLQMLKRIEQAGAAAVVFKSLFEEQIHLESAQMEESMYEVGEFNAEMTSLFPKLKHAGPQEYLANISKAKNTLSIPVFASLNCVENDTWAEYARLIEKAGADGLELNFFAIPGNFENDGRSIEEHQLEILKQVKAKVTFPVSVKLSAMYTNPLNVISKMVKAGANGVVLFNRLFEPDINISDMKHFAPFNLSHEHDYRQALRFAGLLYRQVDASICSNTGIYSGNDVIKMLLSGADCVQVVSVLYKHKPEIIATMLGEIESWMESHKYSSPDDFRGKLSKANVKDPFIYKRAQYIDLILGSEQFFK
ncbi:MAG TPA: dihydroorotate dehydrogenase-like protein [Bacteroidales bacterium]|nr:dihydroorotate dehydrogenase-like protein [Bacteroidales bacterium]